MLKNFFPAKPIRIQHPEGGPIQLGDGTGGLAYNAGKIRADKKGGCLWWC